MCYLIKSHNFTKKLGCETNNNSKSLLNISYVPDTIFSGFHLLIYWIFTATLWSNAIIPFYRWENVASCLYSCPWQGGPSAPPGPAQVPQQWWPRHQTRRALWFLCTPAWWCAARGRGASRWAWWRGPAYVPGLERGNPQRLWRARDLPHTSLSSQGFQSPNLH